MAPVYTDSNSNKNERVHAAIPSSVGNVYMVSLVRSTRLSPSIDCIGLPVNHNVEKDSADVLFSVWVKSLDPIVDGAQKIDSYGEKSFSAKFFR
jgi:hypothetical protein